MDAEKLREITIRRQFAALGNPPALISGSRIRTEGGQVVLAADGKPETVGKRIIPGLVTVDEMLEPECFRAVKGDNCKGWNVFMTPQETTSTIFVLVDDVDLDALERDGFRPNLKLQTSPKSKQAVFALPFLYDKADAPGREARRLYMDVFTWINLKYGDVELRGLRHPFRIAALSNRKPSYEQDGKFPFVKLLSARKGTCPKLATLIDEAAAGKFPLAYEIARMKAVLAGEPEPQPLPAPVMGQEREPEIQEQASAEAHVSTACRPAEHGKDHRDADMTLAWDLAKEGLSGQALQDAFRAESGHLAAPSGYDRGPDRYVERTTDRAEAALEEIRAKQAARKTPPPAPPRRSRPAVAKFAEMARRRREAALAAQA